jgi:hypothetical protein
MLSIVMAPPVIFVSKALPNCTKERQMHVCCSTREGEKKLKTFS